MLNIKKKAISLLLCIFSVGILYLRNTYPCKATAKILSKSEITNNTQPISRMSSIEYQMALLKNEILAGDVIDILRLSNEDGSPLKPENIEEKLKVNLLEENVILVLYFDSDRILAEKVINTLTNQFVNYYIDGNKPSLNLGVDPFLKHSTSVSEMILEEKKKRLYEKRIREAEYKKQSKKYWQEIEEMNRDIPPEFKLDRYQSHDLEVLKFTSSCSRFRYLKQIN